MTKGEYKIAWKSLKAFKHVQKNPKAYETSYGGYS